MKDLIVSWFCFVITVHWVVSYNVNFHAANAVNYRVFSMSSDEFSVNRQL